MAAAVSSQGGHWEKSPLRWPIQATLGYLSAPCQDPGLTGLCAFVHMLSQLLQPPKRQCKSDLLISSSITKSCTCCFQLLPD